ncbi:MAG: 23S rRNA (adenine(2503)-C(2))-methyltransferase RlmN [Candidatus Poribacteria bacterium]|nr:23S rRNA (adenine(2503)-C(2))-methyltransferase RlmN [Candidatus Poribacteria bacterium]
MGTTDSESHRVNLLGLTKAQMIEWIEGQGLPRYRADQLYQWIYHRRVRRFDEMTNLSKALRLEVAARAEGRGGKLAQRSASQVDDTVKYLFELDDGERVESVLMRDQGRITLCVSSQVGCAQDCQFCATAQLGMKRNMTTGEIVSQVLQVEDEIGARAITNIVFMGMGEPLANYKNTLAALEILSAADGIALAARRITISTSGLVPAIARFNREKLKVGLALSLNATTDDVRDRLIPSNQRYKIAGVLDVCREWAHLTRRRLTVEYVLLRDVNDSRNDARRLSELLRAVPSKVNLIPFNEIPGGQFRRPDDRTVRAFQDELTRAHLVTTVRNTKGDDIAAACGQLRADYENALIQIDAPAMASANPS